MILFRKGTVAHFFASDDPVRVLSDYDTLVFDEASAEQAAHPSTTAEIKALCADLKVHTHYTLHTTHAAVDIARLPLAL